MTLKGLMALIHPWLWSGPPQTAVEHLCAIIRWTTLRFCFCHVIESWVGRWRKQCQGAHLPTGKTWPMQMTRCWVLPPLKGFGAKHGGKDTKRLNNCSALCIQVRLDFLVLNLLHWHVKHMECVPLCPMMVHCNCEHAPCPQWSL